MNERDLVLCSGTVMQSSVVDRIDAAARAGFAGLTLFPFDPPAARAAGLAEADLRTYLADHGLAIAYLDALAGWLPGGTAVRPEFATGVGEDELYRMADVLGATSMNVVDLCGGAPLPVDEAAEAFAGVCDRAAAHGLAIHLEFIPWTRIPTLEVAWDIVGTADRGNGGILFDNFHWFRGGGSLESLAAVPGSRITALQLSDATARPPDDLVEEAVAGRLLPGTGAAGVVELVRALDAQGCTAPPGVEVFSAELAALPTGVAIDRAARALRDVIGAAQA